MRARGGGSGASREAFLVIVTFAMLIAPVAQAAGLPATHVGHEAPPLEAPECDRTEAEDGFAACAAPTTAPTTAPTSLPAPAPVDHSAMDHSTMHHGHDAAPPDEYEPRVPVPPVTDADRAAAFRPLRAHAAHGEGVHWRVAMDRLEAVDVDDGAALGWGLEAWLGGDVHRAWLRSEGERGDDGLHAADVELLYGRSVSRWWDVLAGVRHDAAPRGSREFVAVGVQGLAPQKIEVAATAYFGDGQSALRVEAERDVLLTQRWILQPRVEFTAHGRAEPDRGIGAGAHVLEFGVRLRYQVTRRVAPYLGVVHERAFGATADLRREAVERAVDTRVVAGVRFWF